MAQRIDRNGQAVLVFDTDGPALSGSDLVSEAMSEDVPHLAVPASRLGDDFFRLRTGVAGEIAQKVVNYNLTLAVIGDIAHHVAASAPLRDWIVECQRGGPISFHPTMEAFTA